MSIFSIVLIVIGAIAVGFLLLLGIIWSVTKLAKFACFIVLLCFLGYTAMEYKLIPDTVIEKTKTYVKSKL